jgi:hypothetical protein
MFWRVVVARERHRHVSSGKEVAHGRIKRPSRRGDATLHSIFVETQSDNNSGENLVCQKIAKSRAGQTWNFNKLLKRARLWVYNLTLSHTTRLSHAK